MNIQVQKVISYKEALIKLLIIDKDKCNTQTAKNAIDAIIIDERGIIEQFKACL